MQSLMSFKIVTAYFVSNFVAMITRVGRRKIWLISVDDLTPKPHVRRTDGPLYVTRRQTCQVSRISRETPAF